ncbi:MAG TPA: Holliday junction branch migration protein RuvA [Desulfobacteria bacterium]|nr:Holliday junction branch migration protein RuvA [Desulfobacteria bacterium]
MISLLRGVPVYLTEEYVVLEVNGVGYKVYTPTNSAVTAGREVILHTYLQVREDALVLYGFAEKEQLEIFELLISVSGMGPKGALGILSHLSPAQVRQAVATENLSALTKAPGVGKKIAQRLVLELHDKLKLDTDKETVIAMETATGAWEEASEALVALGYSQVEARRAVARALENTPGENDVGKLIKLALKQMG